MLRPAGVGRIALGGPRRMARHQRGEETLKASELDLSKVLEFQPALGKILLGNDRMLLFRQDAFASLRKLLYEQLGETMARAMLMQFGHRCGAGDHESISSQYPWDTELDELAAGPMMHNWEGIVSVEVSTIDFDRQTGRFHLMARWRNSYEADVHVRTFGPSSSPVCHSLTGYASGWCSSFLGAPALAIEHACAGMGAPECRVEIRTPDAWGPEADPWKQSLAATNYSIARELEDKLMTIERQRAAISALSTPIIKVWDGVLALPLIGVMDSARAAQVTEALLEAVVQSGSRYILLDLTGIDVVDTTTANHFVKIIRAVALLGAKLIVTGIAPPVAKTVVGMGVDLDRVQTLATLEDGLKACILQMS
ncbi:XylR N-terminal domain-containing protein [Sorangium sp. So ce385]|uniref:XylR N-terminal domain-containing protein n=1 Tax=Sorangium sp. So ce385 TaxID=3133308 RepID=UPI003F5B88B2